MSDEASREPVSPEAHEALAILLTMLEERMPGTLWVLSDPRTREAAVAALDRCLHGALVELGHLPEGPAPPEA